MSIQFYPAYADPTQDHLDFLYLDVSSFNAQAIFAMLGVKGTGEEGTVGSLDHPQITEALFHMDAFIKENKWIDFGLEEERLFRYCAALNLIMGFCLGNKCKFQWS